MQAAPISIMAIPAAGTPATTQMPFPGAAPQSIFPDLFQGALRGASHGPIPAQSVPAQGKAQDSARAPSQDKTATDPLLLALQVALSGVAVPITAMSGPIPNTVSFTSIPSLSTPGSVLPVDGSAEDSADQTPAGACVDLTSTRPANTRLATTFSQMLRPFGTGPNVAEAGDAKAVPPPPQAATAACGIALVGASVPETTSADRDESAIQQLPQRTNVNSGNGLADASAQQASATPESQPQKIAAAPGSQAPSLVQDQPGVSQPPAQNTQTARVALSPTAIATLPDISSRAIPIAPDPSVSSPTSFSVQQIALDATAATRSTGSGLAQQHQAFVNATNEMSAKALATAGSAGSQPVSVRATASVGDVPAVSRPQAKSTGSGAQNGDPKNGSQHPATTVGSSSDAQGTAATQETPTLAASAANPPVPAAPASVPGTVAATVQQPQSNGGPAAAAPPHASAATSNPPADAASPAGVSLARLVDRAGQTEMRVEMQSDSLGGVELRARLTGDQVGAAISVERHEVHSMLSNELPALHSALVDKNLRVQTLSVSQGTHTLMGGGSGAETNGRGFDRPRAKANFAAYAEERNAGTEPPREWSEPATINGRLSVRA